MKKLISLSLFLFFAGMLAAQTLAFPTAEGYGKWATGGRGGKVVEVTTVEDDAAGSIVGSLRWAVKQFSGQPLTVVFKVSGTIDLKGNEFRCKRNNITFAGQTAPGDGICIKGESFNLGGSFNVIVRNLRFRTGAYTPAGVEINAASVIMENGGNFIVDHCSLSWSSEENCDFADDKDITVQYCIFAEGLYQSVNTKGARSYGAVLAGANGTFHHNLLAHNYNRSPRFGVSTSVIPNVLIDYVNNVNYNFGKSNACYGGENEMATNGTVKVNFVNNYYKQGPAYPNTRTAVFVRPSYEIGVQGTAYSKWHLSGNFIEGTTNQKLNADNYAGVDISEYTAQLPTCTVNNLKSDPFVVSYPVNTESAADAFKTVMTKVGAMPRDTVDRRIINEARTGTASKHGRFNNYAVSGIIDTPEDAGGFPTYVTSGVPVDNDHDGMADAWETANGLDPTKPEDGNFLTTSGYTCLEVYLNSLMGEQIPLNLVSLQDTKPAKLNAFIDPHSKLLVIQNGSMFEQVKLVDMNGKTATQFDCPQNTNLDVSFLPKGSYLLTLTTKDGNQLKTKVIR